MRAANCRRCHFGQSSNSGIRIVPAWRLLLVTVAILCVVYFPIWLGRIVFTSDVAMDVPGALVRARIVLRGNCRAGILFRNWFPHFCQSLHGVFYPLIGSPLSCRLNGWPVF